MEVHHNSVLECDSTTATKNPTKIDAKNDSPNASAGNFVGFRLRKAL